MMCIIIVCVHVGVQLIYKKKKKKKKKRICFLFVVNDFKSFDSVWINILTFKLNLNSIYATVYDKNKIDKTGKTPF